MTDDKGGYDKGGEKPLDDKGGKPLDDKGGGDKK